MPMTLRTRKWLPLSILFFAACDDASVSPKPIPTTLEIPGTYALQSPVDVPPTVLVTGPAAKFLALLQLLHDDPATGLFATLDEAGVPLVNDLYGVLPGSLKDLVRSSINDYMKGRMQGDGGTGSEIDRILAFANSTLTRFTLKSTLTIPTGIAQGTVVGTHAIDTLVFELPGGIPVPVPPEVLQRAMLFPGALQATPTLTAAGPTQGGDASLAIGDHFFGLAYGEAIFSALNGGGTGETLRSRLGGAFDCPTMGQYVAKRCISILCIGHASDITEICMRGLDQVVKKIHDQLSGMNFQALRFEKGAGALWDAPTTGGERDGLVSRLDHGTWTSTIDVGTGPRACKATFTGQRRIN